MTRSLHITKTTGRPYAFIPPQTSEPYALLVLVYVEDVTVAEQLAISRAIVASGARYVAAWGHECSSWDDSVDYAYLETAPNFQPSDETFVITTWHANQSAEEAFEFLWMSGFVDDDLPRSVCAFFIGENTEAQANIQRLSNEFGAKEDEK
jgi:hypothetical protein